MSYTKEQMREYMQKYRKENPEKIANMQGEYDNSEKGATRHIKTVMKQLNNSDKELSKDEERFMAFKLIKAIQTLKRSGWETIKPMEESK